MKVVFMLLQTFICEVLLVQAMVNRLTKTPWNLCDCDAFYLVSHVNSFCLYQWCEWTCAVQHCSILLTCCIQCHQLTISGKASSLLPELSYIYTPHWTRLLKMTLFPMITLWQHTDISWWHPIFWFPWVIQFYIEWYTLWAQIFWSFFPSFFCWKTWVS